MQTYVPHICDECSKALGETRLTLIWFDIVYYYCSERCKTVWHMKRIAKDSLKRA